MLVIGSRALAHVYPAARACLDWDLVGTADELEQLHRTLTPLPGVSQRRDKAYFLHRGAPVEFLLAEHNEWSDVLARPGLPGHEPVLGALTFASPDTQLMLKLAHVHLPRNWEKTSADVALLRRRGARVPQGDPLLERLRQRTERRIGKNECRFAEPGRLRAQAPGNQLLLRSRVHHALGDCVERYADPRQPWRARRLPSHEADAKALLAELTMVHAVTDRLLDVARPNAEQERTAVRETARLLCTRVLGRDVRLCLAPFAHDVIGAIPAGFSHRLLAAARASSALTALGTTVHTRRSSASRDAEILGRFGL